MKLGNKGMWPRLLHQVKRFIVNKRAVLAGIDTSQDGALGAFIAVGVGRGFACAGHASVQAWHLAFLKEFGGISRR